MEIDISELDIKKTHEHLINGDFTVVELTQQCLKNIKEKDNLNAYLEVYDDALEQAQYADNRIKNKDNVTELTGIPIAIKDNILNEGKIVSAGSKILENYKAVYDATIVKKLKDAGAVFIGRTNMDEFAMGASTENSAYGITKNPYDTDRVPGGSSGGSAVAVAINSALVSLGSDTGGSIRQPASFCGVVGLKPTYGAVSRYGLIAMGSSLDQIGHMGKTLSDIEILFNAIKGHDKLDSTSLSDILEKKDIKKKVIIGIPKHFMKKGIDADVLENFNQSVEKLKSLGYEIKEIKLPNIKYSLAVYYIIMSAEASSNLARFDGVKYGLRKDGEDLLGDYLETREQGFGAEVKRRIILGTHILSSGYYDAYYNKANIVRELIKSDFDKAFVDVHAILTPTSPTPAFKIGEKKDPLSMYLSDIFTTPANVTGIPALSAPSGTVERDGKNLPVGLQIMANHGREDILFSIGKDFEKIWTNLHL
jgi:aspartyl-tRNA(Asn)/glutamyl-tRNA(Gln) amidotransferase subunit A